MKEGLIEDASTPAFQRFSTNTLLAYFGVALFYSCWVMIAIGGFRKDHYIFLIGCSLIFFVNQTGRKLIHAFAFLLLYWFIFDSIRIYPNYLLNPPLHISEPYLLEKSLFGITTANGIITPNEFWGTHHNTFLDIFTAIIYISWIPLPLAFAFWLFFTRRRKIMVRFLFTFLLVSQLGLLFQYLYPAAPPWYIELYGFEEPPQYSRKPWSTH